MVRTLAGKTVRTLRARTSAPRRCEDLPKYPQARKRYARVCVRMSAPRRSRSAAGSNVRRHKHHPHVRVSVRGMRGYAFECPHLEGQGPLLARTSAGTNTILTCEYP
ncbi:hypothetical protein CC1G_15506 [Coprinopsis cinerea okayama7|uniref:Uncharacterized protein n=1 Tax=Coprinopsis cinerea (strain Okayama-7 / 130 / ATCC MYA-4618 / FGSC 9003) TaxID=240176 RepID=D6RN87_COPC7|nr:hypothetical protein CC1G_15506 [Coprinopsis cinerea okayama7\|eukprot:XP_002910965.1 hypothetical protein CC1G_15506 [Coprinopsis cinerea okayama7\